MAINYPLTLPTVTGVRSIELQASNAVAISRSPFTFASQVHAYSGQMWSASLTLPPMKRSDRSVRLSLTRATAILTLTHLRGRARREYEIATQKVAVPERAERLFRVAKNVALLRRVCLVADGRKLAAGAWHRARGCA